MEIVFFALTLAIIIPIGLYISGRMAGRDVWGLFLRGYEKRGTGAYRMQVRPVWVAGKPPISVHIAAITSFILGQMVVPGALSALVGVLAALEILSRGAHDPADYVIFVLVLSAPTGLWIGGKLLTVGLNLLQRTADAAKGARNVAHFSIAHNVVLIACMAAIYLMATNDAVYFPAVYACVSISHALLLLKAARDVEAHGEKEQHDREIAIRPPQLADRPI